MDMGSEYTQADASLGKRIIAACLDAICVCVALAVASCFAAWWSMLLAFIISLLLLALAELAAAFAIDMMVDDSTFGAIGKTAYSVSSTVTGWFTKG
jgi:hypothetical protein